MTQQSDEVDLDKPTPVRNKANVKEIKDISYDPFIDVSLWE